MALTARRDTMPDTTAGMREAEPCALVVVGARWQACFVAWRSDATLRAATARAYDDVAAASWLAEPSVQASVTHLAAHRLNGRLLRAQPDAGFAQAPLATLTQWACEWLWRRNQFLQIDDAARLALQSEFARILQEFASEHAASAAGGAATEAGALSSVARRTDAAVVSCAAHAAVWASHRQRLAALLADITDADDRVVVAGHYDPGLIVAALGLEHVASAGSRAAEARDAMRVSAGKTDIQTGRVDVPAHDVSGAAGGADGRPAWPTHFAPTSAVPWLQHLRGPILDIGAGDGRLVAWLQAHGVAATGIDRIASPHVQCADWFSFAFEPRAWGTIVSHHAFALFFQRWHVVDQQRAAAMARTYLRIVESLQVGGTFAYVPALPFMEAVLPSARFRVARYGVPRALAHAAQANGADFATEAAHVTRLH